MTTIGERLRHERESREKTLEQMRDATGIGVTFLDALEKDDFNALPGRAFGKLYIRAYGEALGFDPQPLVDAYDREQRLVPDDGRRWRPEPIEEQEEPAAGTEAEPEAEPEPVAPVVKDEAPSPSRPRLAALAVIGVAAIATILYLAGRRPPREPTPNAPPVAPAAVPTPPDPQPAPPPAVEPPRVPPPPAPGARLRVTESGVGRRVVRGRLEGGSDRFAPGGAVWFQTRVLGGRAGESIRHVWSFNGRAEQSIVLRLGASDWRTHSNKTIYKVGAWTVEARDADGNVLASAAFNCETGGI